MTTEVTGRRIAGLAFPALGFVEIGGDFAAVVKLLQLLRWESV